MAQRLKSFDGDILKEFDMDDVFIAGGICFLARNTMIPVRFHSPSPSSFDKENTYYYVPCP